MLAKTFSAITVGLTPIKVEVEVDGTQGTPNLIIIGLPNKTVDEARERITSAIINSGIRIRSKRTIVNLAPADVKKTSSAIELAIVIGILKMYGEVARTTNDCIFFGELSLDGQIKPIKGALPLVMAAQKMGFTHIFVPAGNLDELQLVANKSVTGVSHLKQVIAFLRNESSDLPNLPKPASKPPNPTVRPVELDLAEIYGNRLAKMALIIAVAGGHNVLFMGPPGTGKSMLAKSLPSILPALEPIESVEATSIHSICGLTDTGFLQYPPVRKPHHSASAAAIIGGGTQLQPGEISLAHKGFLFLDELPEFSRQVLESLRQPLEDGHITLARAAHKTTFPAQFTLVATANPCPCGMWGSQHKMCTCTPGARQKYQQKLSGPILDRIDLFSWVEEQSASHFLAPKVSSLTSSQAVEKITFARKMQKERYLAQGISLNHQLSPTHIKNCSFLTPALRTILDQAYHSLKLSPRSYFSVIKVARTIADLDQSLTIKPEHLHQALQLRPNLPTET